MLPYLVLLKAVGSEEGIVVSSFSAVYATVAMVTRFRVLEALFFFFGDRKRDRRKDRENLDSSDNWALNLLKY